MTYFLLKRILQGLIVVLGVTLTIFMIMRVIPGDPVRQMVSVSTTSEETMQKVREELGLDKPLLIQFGRYLQQVSKGDLGTSFFKGAENATSDGSSKAPVLALLTSRLPLTLSLSGFALLFAIVIGIPAGFLAAIYPRSLIDRIVTFASVVFQSIPNFWLGIMAILLITVKLELIPSMGYKDPRYLILPGMVLGVSLLPVLMRVMKAAVVDILESNFVKVMRARGISEWRILFKHVLKNASIPLITLLGIQLGYLLGGALIIEYIFDFPGIGLLTIFSVLQRDFPVIQGVVLFFGTVFVVINIAVDTVYAYIDPRIR